MSQYELAQAVGVARQTINLIENDKNNQTLLCYMSINILFLTYGICGYVLIATRRRHLLENEVLDIQIQKLHLKFLATRQGILFGLFNYLFNVLMYMFQRLNLKKVQ